MDPILAALRYARRMIAVVVGLTLLLAGVVLFFTPVPGGLIVLFALGILAGEFVWARKLLKSLKDLAAERGFKL